MMWAALLRAWFYCVIDGDFGCAVMNCVEADVVRWDCGMGSGIMDGKFTVSGNDVSNTITR
jgi:hypothetical protein